MLTPAQIKSISFNRLEGDTYSASEVDEAFERIAADYSDSVAENGSMVRKLGVLAAKIEEYRKDENVLRDVLYNAQKSADMIIASAKEQADQIVGNAEAEVDSIKAEADGTLDDAVLKGIDIASKLELEAHLLRSGALREAEEKAEKINAAAEAEYASIISSAKVLSDGYMSAARESSDAIAKETEKTVNDLIADCDQKAAAILESAQRRANQLL